MKRIAPFIHLSTQKGLTLLELIVSLTIGLFLLLAMALTYNIGFRVSQQVSDISNLHNNARAIFERIGRDLSMAGYVDLMDRPFKIDEPDSTTFKDFNDNQCLTFPPNSSYATHTLDFSKDNVVRMYSRAVDDKTSTDIDRNRLNTIGLISCGQMMPVVGCDGDFSRQQPSARALLPDNESDFARLCRNIPYNPASQDNVKRAINSQIQIAYQAQSVSSNNDKISLRQGSTHQNDGTGIVFDSGTNLNALDCAGNPIANNQNGFVVNRYRFSLANGADIARGDTGRLECSGNGALGAGNNQYIEIANNIREFKIRYRLGAHEKDDTELQKSRTSALVQTNRIASELNRSLTANAAGHSAIPDTDLGWSRVVGVEVCLVVAAEPTDGIIPSNLAESQELIPTCVRDVTNRELYAASTRRDPNDKKYYLRLTKTFSIPNSIFQFEVNRS